MSDSQGPENKLLRYVEIDSLLASAEGLHAPSYCEETGLSRRTLGRYLEFLRGVGAEITVDMLGGENVPRGKGVGSGKAGTQYVHRYANRRRRIFSAWVAESVNDTGG